MTRPRRAATLVAASPRSTLLVAARGARAARPLTARRPRRRPSTPRTPPRRRAGRRPGARAARRAGDRRTTGGGAGPRAGRRRHHGAGDLAGPARAATGAGRSSSAPSRPAPWCWPAGRHAAPGARAAAARDRRRQRRPHRRPAATTHCSSACRSRWAGPPATAAPGRSLTRCFPGAGERPAPWWSGSTGPPRSTRSAAPTCSPTTGSTAADNAAVALRLLGQRGRLVWYVPDLRDVAAGDTGSSAAQLPAGLVPALWLLAVAVLATMLWRGRRLGPLVVEPLPVVVKAVESTQGRGRLYAGSATARTPPGILRAATAPPARRPAPARATDRPRGLVGAVARTTGRDPPGGARPARRPRPSPTTPP